MDSRSRSDCRPDVRVDLPAELPKPMAGRPRRAAELSLYARLRRGLVQLAGALLMPVALAGEPQKVTITIEDLADEIHITVEDTGAQRDERACRDAQRQLNGSGRNELRDYYGGLAGEDHLGPCDLRIVGMMVDGGSVERGEGSTRIKVWWKQD